MEVGVYKFVCVLCICLFVLCVCLCVCLFVCLLCVGVFVWMLGPSQAYKYICVCLCGGVFWELFLKILVLYRAF